jgi:hypothetical protein
MPICFSDMDIGSKTNSKLPTFILRYLAFNYNIVLEEILCSLILLETQQSLFIDCSSGDGAVAGFDEFTVGMTLASSLREVWLCEESVTTRKSNLSCVCGLLSW